ncbi:adenosylmethionine decarboxylase [Aliivibrio sp. S10_S31]|uniref:adenosylmethionine decarboxylase n=1 Tax=Aliivibrio sp. S10_S31 TaxID=2720224 RepID=UPI001680388F|nr:adenosylmethionine decarboxylase [Aliivibrio sp. S10_S31]MBD1569476.1 adenosylmethionine decarboxylase [Aliivibrio sp. S10_S31]
MDSQGYHYLIDIECKSPHLNNEKILKDNFNNILNESEFNIVGFLDKKFAGEGGVTGVFLLSESHLSYHTYPENNYISIDLYTCGKDPTKEDLNKIKSIFNPITNLNISRVKRGINGNTFKTT